MKTIEETREDCRRMTARNMRYKKPALLSLEYEHIRSELYDIYTECGEEDWALSDDEMEIIIDALGGDEEEVRGVRLMFCDLAAKCEKLTGELNDWYSEAPKYFNDFFVGCVGNKLSSYFATFPPELIRPCVLAGSRLGGIVLDPFFGVGTTGLVAMEEQRGFIGIDLNPEYIEMARNRLGSAIIQYHLPL